MNKILLILLSSIIVSCAATIKNIPQCPTEDAIYRYEDNLIFVPKGWFDKKFDNDTGKYKWLTPKEFDEMLKGSKGI
jgi:hypothetical protein